MINRHDFLDRLARFGVMLTTALVLSACGGGGGSSSGGSSNTQNPVSYAANQVPITVGYGVEGNVNTPTVSVTICAPGSTTNCQTIDNVLLDTGSYGLRLTASAVSNLLGSLPAQGASGGGTLAECTVFLNKNFMWGSVRLADVHMAGETAGSVPIQIVGDPSLPSAQTAFKSGQNFCWDPTDSSSEVADLEASTPQQLGANGILGIGVAVPDCGAFCASSTTEQEQTLTTPPSSVLASPTYSQTTTYYACSGSSCPLASVPTNQQIQNPLALFATDNNGVVVSFDNPSGGTAGGTLTFGVSTQTNNMLSASAPRMTTDGNGDLSAALNGYSFAYNANAGTYAFFDTGSNGLFFPSGVSSNLSSSSCGNWYCTSSGQNLGLSGSATGQNGVSESLALSIANAGSVLPSTVGGSPWAIPGLSGPQALVLDLGLPFFYGRSVYQGFDLTATTGAAPYISF